MTDSTNTIDKLATASRKRFQSATAGVGILTTVIVLSAILSAVFFWRHSATVFTGLPVVMATGLALAFIVWTVALADCPEPTPPGGCGVDTISPTATQTVPPIEPYPPPDETPAPYPGPAFLPFVAEESYP